MASIARGLETGVNLGFRIDQALREKERRDALRAATEDKAFAKYSPEQGARMRAEAEMVDEFGRPKYEYSIEPGSTTYTRREITYPGAPTGLGGMSVGGPAYEEAVGLTPSAQTEIARVYRVPPGSAGPEYEFVPDLTGEAVYAPGQPQVTRGGLGRELSVRDTGISRPIEAGAVGPEDTAAYRGLTRQLGEATTMMAPELTEYLGQTVKGGLSKEDQRSMLLDRYADIISRDDPVEGAKLRAMALQEKIAGYQLKQLVRSEKQDAAEEALLEDLKARPELLQGDLSELFASRGIRPERANKMIEGVLGIENGTITRMQNMVKKAWLGSKGSLSSFLEKSLSDKDYDPTSHLVQRKGPGGGIIIDTVETLQGGKSGRVLSSTPELPNEAEAMDYLFNALTNPGTAAQTALKNQETRSKIEENIATAEQRRAYAGALRAGGGVGKNAFEVAGMDTDNQPILFNKQTGEFGRRDGKPIQDPDFVKKFRGAEAASISRQEEISYAELLKSDAWQRAKTPAARAELMRKYNLDPEKFRMPGIPGGGW